MLESIYYVITWACQRSCAHCYDSRFRQYHGAELARMLEREREAFPKVVGNLPEKLIYCDTGDQRQDGSFVRKNGRIILSGGEVLLEPVREQILYPLMEMLNQRYDGLVKLIIQTSGDPLSARVVEELLERKVWTISVSSLDDYHARQGGSGAFQERLRDLFESAGMRPAEEVVPARKSLDQDGPYYSFFGATPDAWIGKLWPAGRAWQNGLSTARYEDNFCNAWSGGLNFLNLGHSGSEVAIDPEGNVYPCCRKTRLPYGNLCQEPLRAILERLSGLPQFEAINSGHPERMGLSHGVGLAEFIELCRVTDPKGRAYVNRCIGCDRMHEKYLGDLLARLRPEKPA